MAQVDPDKLRSALLNLVINAATAIPGQGTITVRTRMMHVPQGESGAGHAPGDYIEIDVVDDGAGMTPEVADRAFEPFFTTKEVGVGTGMGLSSVYGLVRQSGGHASLDTAPGAGTTVVLCLPVATEAAPERPLMPGGEGAVPASGHRILMVESDSEHRAAERSALRRGGHDIVEVASGDAALARLDGGEAFDLVVTDVAIPGAVNGVQLARRAQAMQPAPRVLLTSLETGVDTGDTGGKVARARPADSTLRPIPSGDTGLVEKVQAILDDDIAASG